MDSPTYLTAEQVAQRTGKSKSQVNRDAAGDDPKLPAAVTFPGYNGPRLFDPATVATVYGASA
jgi:hypothetical protein